MKSDYYQQTPGGDAAAYGYSSSRRALATAICNCDLLRFAHGAHDYGIIGRRRRCRRRARTHAARLMIDTLP